jgi:phenylalanyl-tRNA synthetase alpha chain
VTAIPDLRPLQEEALAAVRSAGSLEDLEQTRVRFTGKRSGLVAAQQSMRDLDADGKRELGQALNAFKSAFETAFEERREDLAARALADRLEQERLDLTLPPRRLPPGRPHLLTQVLDEIVDVFVGMGYRVAEGPEAEAATYNFDMMNIPADHPARQEMDTIYVDREQDVVLRTHTSPVQARVMTSQPPPVAVVVPGRVFRADSVDATHSPVFHQVEGLLVDEGITMADLRGTLLAFARAMFGTERDVRLRPSMFPFTEPSAEVDVSCGFCAGDGAPCRVCSGTGWIEVLGAGMVDPAVLSACGVDPERYSGFAFGVGAERVAMLRHGVADIRDFYDGDVRFLRTF